MRRKSHVRFGLGEKAEITSKPYLSVLCYQKALHRDKRTAAVKRRGISHLQASTAAWGKN